VRRGAAAVAALVVVSLGPAQSARALPLPATPAATAAPAAPASNGAGTLDAVATEIARVLASGTSHVPEGTKVVASSVTSDVAGTRGDDLGARLAARVAAHLAPLGSASAEPRTGALSVAAAAASRSPALVYLAARIVAGKLEVNADLYPTVSNGWDRVRTRAPQPVGHAFAAGRVDAEIRTFLPPILLEQATLDKAPLHLPAGPDGEGANEVLALGCGDADGDGNVDLVVSTRARLLVGRLRGGAFSVDRVVAWKDLASRAPAILREPVASFAFAPRFAAGTSDRGGVSFVDDLRRTAQFAGIPVGSGACVRLDGDGTGFSGPAVPCEGDAATAVAVTKLPAARYDGALVWMDVRKDGQGSLVAAAREPNGKLHVSFAGADEVLSGAGASFAVGDLDLDGVPEVVTARNVPPPGASEGPAEADAVQVVSLGTGGKPRLRFAAPAGVRALAVCPAEARSLPAVAAIVGDEVWLVR
jgi:hypothetical protein